MKSAFERTIYFENEPLPVAMVHVDHLGMYGTIPEFPEATSEWLWRFVICFGCVKTDSAASVIHHCGVAHKLARENRDVVIGYIGRAFKNRHASEMFDDWRRGFEIMICAAKGRTECSWFAPLTECEDCTRVSPGELLRRLNLAYDKPPNKG